MCSIEYVSRFLSKLFVILTFAFIGCDSDQALTQLQFSELVRDRTEEEYPGILISDASERGFDYARGNGERGRMVVTEEYAYYTRHPEALDELVDRLVSLIGTRERLAKSQHEPNRILLSILPVIKPRSFLVEAQERSQGQQLLYGEHPTGLFVFFVFDEPRAISFLASGTLQGLGLSPRRLEQLASDNLARRTGPESFVVESTEAGDIAVGNTRDGYDAARLISPLLLLTLSRMLDSSAFLVAIPRRDLILAIPADDGVMRPRLTARARSEYHAGPYPITSDLFIVDRAGVRRAN